jgi:hypothetical protein
LAVAIRRGAAVGGAGDRLAAFGVGGPALGLDVPTKLLLIADEVVE